MTTFSSKQPAEAFAVSFDFTDSLGLTEAIDSVTSVIAIDQSDGSDASLIVLDSTKQSNTTKIVYAWVRAGTAGHSYAITCNILGDAGSVYELDGILPVDAVPAVLPASGNGLVAGPALEPITLAELKLHLRVDADTTDDSWLNDCIEEARTAVEDWTRRKIMTQTWDYCLDCWPSKNYIDLPDGNLQSVTYVKWKDTAGIQTTLTETINYIVEKNGSNRKGRIVLPYGISWPSGTLYPSNPIVIRYICGWTTPALVSRNIRAMIKEYCAYKNEHRGEPVIGQTVIENKFLDKLIWLERLW